MTTESDEYQHLFELRGNQRGDLNSKTNIRLGAKLLAVDPGRFEELLDTLKNNGMTRLREWERRCEKALSDAKKRGAAKAAADRPETDRPVVERYKTLGTARLFSETCAPHLIVHGGDWLDYDAGAYTEQEHQTVRQRLMRFLESAVMYNAQTRVYEPVPVDGALLSGVLDVLATDVHAQRGAFSPPCWLDPQENDPPAREVLSLRNGLLHIPSGVLQEPTPRFFTLSALPFDYDPDAPAPDRWLQCLEEWWPESPESRDCLQEMFGYLLLPDTSLQKIFLLIGISRGGKGTVVRVLSYLLGKANHVSPTLDQLAQPFGMQSMIGKQLATMTDLYVHRAGKASIAVENLLRISGEDDVTVQRKHKTDWVGRLPTRFLLAGTVAPVLPDMSGSLTNRYVPLLMKNTFVNREDPYLFEGKLVPEMPGILNWAIEGWRRLKQRGHFVLPPEGAALVQELRALANPVEAFLRECCVVEKGARIRKAVLHNEFERWAEGLSGLSFQYMEQKDFTRRLIVASGYRIEETRPRTGVDGRQEWWFRNVRLADDLLPGSTEQALF